MYAIDLCDETDVTIIGNQHLELCNGGFVEPLEPPLYLVHALIHTYITASMH